MRSHPLVLLFACGCLFPSLDGLDEAASDASKDSTPNDAIADVPNDGSDGCGTTNVCFEAESGVIVAPMEVQDDPTASGGKSVIASANNAGSVTWTFDVATAGTYVIWCRIVATNEGTDSFFASIDGGSAIEYDTSWQNGTTTVGPQWQWTEINTAQDQTDEMLRTFTLSAGSHTLEFGGREQGSVVDRLIVTSDLGFVPL